MSTPEEETVAALHYDVVEQVISAAETIMLMHPEDKSEQVRKMLYLCAEAMQAYVQAIPGLKRDHIVDLAGHAFDIARSQNPPHSPPTSETLN